MLGYKNILFCFFLFAAVLASGQNDWELKKSENGIDVYLKSQDDSNIKMLKIVFDVEEPFLKVAHALDDVEACTEWVYACDVVDIYDEAEDGATIKYYTLIDFPWPLRDRDAYVESHTEMTENTFTSTSKALTDEAIKDGIVRMSLMDIRWYAEKKAEELVEVTYTLRSDPGGMIPAWAINLAIDSGPIRSIEAFRTFVANR